MTTSTIYHLSDILDSYSEYVSYGDYEDAEE